MTLLVIVFIICLLVYIPQAAKRNQKEQARASLKKGSWALRNKLCDEWGEIIWKKIQAEHLYLDEIYDWCVNYIETQNLPSYNFNKYYKSDHQKDARI